MIERILDSILSVANFSLKDYYKHCSEIGPYVKRHYNFKPKFCNERSIASFMTNYFYLGLIGSKQFNSVKYISEFAIKLNTSKTKEEFDELKSKHGLNHLKTPKHFLELFYPDTIFQINQNQRILNIFIEYKVSSKFILAELSYDFLKYLLYTDKSTASSVFVYILLSKNNNDEVYLLSDAKGFPTTYKIISDDFTEELKVLGSSKSIFIYEKRDNISFAEQSYMELDVLREISNVISVIKEEEISTESIVCAQNFLDNPFISQMDKFGENVITSSLLKENYFKILEIREKISSNEMVNILMSDECPINLRTFKKIDIINDEDKDEFVVKVASYFNNQMKKILEGLNQNKSVFNYSYRRSNWILIVIAKFLQINEIEISGFNIKDFCENDDDKREIEELLEKAYEKQNYKNNISSLGISLIYYITEVYPIVFDINDNRIIMKETYRAYKSKKTLIGLIHDFRRINTGKKRMRKEDWNEIDIENALAEIAISVFTTYLD